MAKYRIVTDNYAGYEPQRRRFGIWWPSIKTFSSIERAKAYIEHISKFPIYFTTDPSVGLDKAEQEEAS